MDTDPPLSIYDVLRALVDKAEWRTDNDEKRMIDAISRAEKNQLFGTEGMMKL